MTRQQEQTTQLATAMTEMTSTVHEVANNTAQAAEAANEADNQAVTGDEVVQQSVNMIEQLAEEIASAGNHGERGCQGQRADWLGAGGDPVHRRADQSAGPQRRHRGGPGR